MVIYFTFDCCCVILFLIGSIKSGAKCQIPPSKDEKDETAIKEASTTTATIYFTPLITSPRNFSDVVSNVTESDANGTTSFQMTTVVANVLPEKGSQDAEHKSSMAIFFILFVIVLSILLVHVLLVTKFHYIPESFAIVVLGGLIGFILSYSERDWSEEEALKPNVFFLMVLPPIIFESGYNLHKGNFFANIGSILVFAIIGTAISALIVGGGIYVLGQADLIYELTAVNSFAFGSMISAVDPVATLAIFQALDVDPLLYMLVFGESVLNDAVAIVLASTVMELKEPSMAGLTTWAALSMSFRRFFLMFFGSAVIGVCAGLTCALLLKHVDLRKTPSLEFAVMLVFSYLPYGFAEGIHLSGIMAILFCGITMSHYTHYNVSPMTQITMQQTFRTLAFVAETCTFAYLGMACFTFPLLFDPIFVLWGIILCLIGRAFNIFPLSFVVNKFREHPISRKNQFVMWFSGLRGAVAFALALHMEFEDEKTQRIMLATTLCIVVFTILVLGGSTMPLLKILNDLSEDRMGRRKRLRRKGRKRRPSSRGSVSKRPSGRQNTKLILSKTQELNAVVDTEYSYSEYGQTDDALSAMGQDQTLSARGDSPRLKGLAKLDACFIRPFFVRKFTVQEKKESTMRLTEWALQWYKAAEQDSDSEDQDTLFLNGDNHCNKAAASVNSEQTIQAAADFNFETSDEQNEDDNKPLI